MSSIERYQHSIEYELGQFIHSLSAQSPSELYEPIVYTLSLEGKRVRPLLLMMGNGLFSGNEQRAIGAAVAVELFHNFTLIHDDIMDRAPVRRGKPTVYEKWGDNIAVLAGDVMQVQAYQYLAKCDADILPVIIGIFNSTAIQVCEGQQMDMNFERRKNVSIVEYLKMIESKTAVLLAASLQMGAVCAKASKNDADALYNFGLNMGLAFQLQDDILDVYGNTEKFGKQKGGDIIANKKTYLLLKAFELLSNNGEKLNELQAILELKDPEKKVTSVVEIYDRLNIKQLAEAEVAAYYKKSLQSLQEIEANTVVKNELLLFAETLMNREK